MSARSQARGTLSTVSSLLSRSKEPRGSGVRKSGEYPRGGSRVPRAVQRGGSRCRVWRRHALNAGAPSRPDASV